MMAIQHSDNRNEVFIPTVRTISVRAKRPISHPTPDVGLLPAFF